MISTKTRHTNAAPAAHRPTEYLLRVDPGQLTVIMTYRLIAKGFELRDVQEMLSQSDLYSAKKVILRIMGKSTRTIQRLSSKAQPYQLNSQQSAVALQYAKAMEHAINVFGTYKLAEEWLGRPCGQLDGAIPVEIIDNPLGFQVVEDYLERVEYGVYQ